MKSVRKIIKSIFFLITFTKGLVFTQDNAQVIFPFQEGAIPPAAPSNLTLSNASGYPHLNWVTNNEPDLTESNIYRKLEGADTEFIKIATINHATTTFTDYTVLIGDFLDPTVEYYITTIDLSSNESNPSNIVFTFHEPKKFLVGQTSHTDTLSYSNITNDTFELYLDEIALVVHKMPADGIIKGLNIPIASWGDSTGRLVIEMYTLNYPLDSTGNQYDSTLVDENGWLGYYPHSSNDSIILPHYQWGSDENFWNTFGDSGVCTGIPSVANSFPPLWQLTWYGDFAACTMDPFNHSVGDNNWMYTQDFNWEPEMEEGEYIGIYIKYYSGNNNSPISFYASDSSAFTDPWRLLTFNTQCNGPSGEGGWHIRSETINAELAIEYEESSTDYSGDLPSSIYLYPNYPNPFNAITNIKYDLPIESKINITIYDILGREIINLTNTIKQTGTHTIKWNGLNNLNEPVNSGIYIVKLTTQNNIQTKKLVLIK